MAKIKSLYICSCCGFESPRWNGKCQQCGSWNTFEECSNELAAAATAQGRKSVACTDKIVDISEISTEDEVRYFTGSSELDRVLGGGLVKGSIVLLGGEPGIGKSTLLMQICQYMGEEHSILYVSGEESARQLKLRSQRLGVNTESLYILTLTDAEAVCATVAEASPDVVIIDSVQTMVLPDCSSSAGSLTQVRECTNLFMKTAKALEIPIFIVGHVNKDGAIAGPKVMEHIVDAVLYFEGERNLSYRILRAVKNRFGSTNEIGIFEMAGSGLVEVPDPSQLLLSGRPVGISGICIACVIEGSRPILAEVQVLASKSAFSAPRRLATGFDYNRMTILLAVLEKRGGIFCGNLDVYLNIVGGFRLDEPAGDLPVALALYSAIMDIPINEKTIAFGEIGLGGEIRAVTRIEQRLREAERIGFELAIIPEQSRDQLDSWDGKMKLCYVGTISQAFGRLGK